MDQKVLKDCLKWIGQHMGIKQASLLAEVGLVSFRWKYRLLTVYPSFQLSTWNTFPEAQ